MKLATVRSGTRKSSHANHFELELTRAPEKSQKEVVSFWLVFQIFEALAVERLGYVVDWGTMNQELSRV